MRPLALTLPPIDARHFRMPASSDPFMLRPSDVDLWCTSLDDQPAPMVQSMQAILSPDEIARGCRFHFERDRRRHVIGRGILRTLLGRYLERGPAEIALEYGPNGKPSLGGEWTSRRREAGAARIFFNLTHSDGIALYAFTRGGEVGIDLEAIRDLPDFDQVAASAFSPPELARWRACPRDERREEFFRAWTRQEAVLKARGTGLGGAATPAFGSEFRVYPLHPSAGFAAALAVAPGVEWATLRRWPHDVRDEGSDDRPLTFERIRIEDLSDRQRNFL